MLCDATGRHQETIAAAGGQMPNTRPDPESCTIRLQGRQSAGHDLQHFPRRGPGAITTIIFCAPHSAYIIFVLAPHVDGIAGASSERTVLRQLLWIWAPEIHNDVCFMGQRTTSWTCRVPRVQFGSRESTSSACRHVSTSLHESLHEAHEFRMI